MEYANTFSLDFPVELWRPFAQDRPSVRCSSGYLIYLQGTEATCFYYLKKGKVKSFIQSEDGAERTLNLYQQGFIFGEASFFDERPRVSSAVALTPCQLVPIDRELVTQEIAKHPELALAMMKYLARTVRLLSGHVDQMAFRPARWRVARYLLTLPAEADGSLRCTHEEIGSAVGVSRVTVSRALGTFVRRGWVETGYRSMCLINREALKNFSEQGAALY